MTSNYPKNSVKSNLLTHNAITTVKQSFVQIYKDLSINSVIRRQI